MRIPMSSPDISAEDVQAVLSVLQSRTLALGPRSIEFEREIAAYVGASHAVAVSSGTAGLHLCVIAAGVRDGDYMITTPFSFIASANCLLYERATPIFVDIEPVAFNINPALAAEAIDDIMRERDAAIRWLPPAQRTARPLRFRSRLKGVLPVHVFGQPADMDHLLAATRPHQLAVIEDACEALGAEYRGRRVGASGDVGVFAFYANKQMTTAEGGVIVTNHAEWDALFRSLRNQGRDIFDAWLNHSRLGYNYRMTELSAALGIVQLGRIDTLIDNRTRIASWYEERLRSIDGVEPLTPAPSTTRMSWFVYVVRLSKGIERRTLMAALEARGVPTRPYFTPIHLQPFYRDRFGYRPGTFPVTEEVAESTLALPFSGVMSEDQVDYVCDTLRQVLPTMTTRVGGS